MLKRNEQIRLDLSRFSELYDILIPKDNILRQMKEQIDFLFGYFFSSLAVGALFFIYPSLAPCVVTGLLEYKSLVNLRHDMPMQRKSRCSLWSF